MAALNANLEALAVGLGLLYLVLAIREQRIAWIAGGLASTIFLFVFWRARLPMQAGLQVYYVVVAILAWRRWSPDESQSTLRVSEHSIHYHLAVIALLSALTVISVFLRDALADSQVWLDAVTSWGGVIATWMVAQKVLSAWVYWIIIDLVTAALYWQADLPASAALFLVYTALAALAWRQWRISLHSATVN